MTFFKQVLPAAVVGLAAFGLPSSALGSDHNEAPTVKTDATFDITDVYVFRGAEAAEDETTVIVNFAGLNDAPNSTGTGDTGVYNPNVLYTLNIDSNMDNIPDQRVYWRYGANEDGNFGVQVENLPGGAAIVSGPVDRVNDGGNGTRYWSAAADDPFFFDVEGYLNTLATGDLMIREDRDSLAGLNVTSLVLEFKTSAVRQGANPIQVWATASIK